ncbi:lipoyl domain-containing protein [Streptomyces sp. NPDC092296]|uniref:lipoyl domain-containing protein n=1 Tax=Streptomyces sp. NPDC092296 TaxID=3366012 RepID=UPI003808DED9
MTITATERAAAVVEPGSDRPVRLLGARLAAGAAALLLAVGAGAAWAALGSLPHTLALPAVLAHGTAPALARTATAGSVLDVRVQPGDRVTAGRPLAVLRTAHGTEEVRAPAAGTVTALLAPPGTTVAAGGAVAALDPAAEPATVRLFATTEQDAVRLRPGREVLLPLPDGSTLRARITDVRPLPARADSLDGTLPVALPGLPGGGAPVWTAYARPEPTPADPAGSGPLLLQASVDLGARHPYQVVLGTGGDDR